MIKIFISLGLVVAAVHGNGKVIIVFYIQSVPVTTDHRDFHFN